jgi:hypothetical protein
VTATSRTYSLDVCRDGDGLRIKHSGHPDALLAAGAITPELLAPGRRGVRRVDEDGDRIWVTRRGDGQWARIVRWKPIATARRLPGVEAWLADHPHPLDALEPSDELLEREAGAVVAEILKRIAGKV